MKAVLNRVAHNKDGTFGVLIIDDKPICVTLEEVWKDNQKLISSVPEGRYTVSAYSGTKYKNVWILENVPGRSAILIHWGNTNDNTAGCILMGKYYADFGGKRGVAESVKTIEMLRTILPKKFTLDIVNNY